MTSLLVQNTMCQKVDKQRLAVFQRNEIIWITERLAEKGYIRLLN